MTQWVDELTYAVLEHGAAAFMYLLAPGEGLSDTTLALWAHEIVPGVRDSIRLTDAPQTDVIDAAETAIGTAFDAYTSQQGEVILAGPSTSSPRAAHSSEPAFGTPWMPHLGDHGGDRYRLNGIPSGVLRGGLNP